MGEAKSIRYPRRTVLRTVMRWLTGRLISVLGDLELVGLEHVPKQGRVILAANHFNFVDAPLMLYAAPRMLEFIGGANMVDAPAWAKILPKMWGIIPAYRGTYSRSTLRKSLDVLAQDAPLCIFPEGGSWAETVRPARPGTAMIAQMSGAQVVPVSIIGASALLKKGRSKVRIVFHPPLDPPVTSLKGPERRLVLDEFGDKLMSVIASALPEHQQGKFSADEQIRMDALAVSDFPFEQPHMRGM
ncbi:lysophospholipid acyltransferase family protein [Hyphomonas sp. FCG-A18]|uniref:lysophospholipid acyltransferase family protein n=1 Tax=Hyphomonas sp. FCG-A18 TaxID=3080019 RepID=UPI002B2AF7BC|nr:lysophospholipid acyltransferase family protein [Hyphomonas sp. FCG-A18]